MPLSRTQADAIVKVHQDASGYPGVGLREPTKLALIKKGLAYRENLPSGDTNGWMLKLTEKGRARAQLIIKARTGNMTVDDDHMENWESYE